jgi:3-oxoacyl-[acyl-carrier protein] reductase
MGELSKKVAIITGGARGMGKQIALTLAGRGADIVLGDVLDMTAAAKEINQLGREVVTVKADVTKKADVQNLVASAIDKFKRVDILVNDAGITRRALLMDMTEEDWDAVIGVNLKGVFLCTQAVAKVMIEQRYGKIINLASIAGINALLPGTANYATSKAAVIRFTAACALELGPYGINVNAIAPGTIVTDLTRAGRTPAEFEEFVERTKEKSALHRVGTPHDIANVIAFLASDESSFITGQVIPVEGGRFGAN